MDRMSVVSSNATFNSLQPVFMIVGDGLQKIVDFIHVSEASINVAKATLNMIQMYFHTI
jgi:hypothetical protein